MTAAVDCGRLRERRPGKPIWSLRLTIPLRCIFPGIGDITRDARIIAAPCGVAADGRDGLKPGEEGHAPGSRRGERQLPALQAKLRSVKSRWFSSATHVLPIELLPEQPRHHLGSRQRSSRGARKGVDVAG